jgi:hypothetical protein
MISCRVLGPPDLTVDGGAPPAELLWRKNLALLVYLALSPRRTRAREHLVGLLWSDKPESAARHSLNEALRVLRRVTGDDGIISDPTTVRLADGIIALDTEAFATHDLRDRWGGRDAGRRRVSRGSLCRVGIRGLDGGRALGVAPACGERAGPGRRWIPQQGADR